ncbi:MAG: tRNA 2-thiouridine(34) synthase MnmA [Syntrophorhabdales bacterium]|jgi:tRNA-specific 2-thiouridylase|nr:tRNA 2-thiouridine(34) synthase MnmA [Syntrophorhabdales bacterium]
MKKTVVVGMSGGIDSTVTALLLLTKGFHVIGITMSIWEGTEHQKNLREGCYGPKETTRIEDVKKVASMLGIEHHVIDLKKEFKKIVLEYCYIEYTSGRTPNPCIICNSEIKFNALLQNALSAGINFDYTATGHYARIIFDKTSQRFQLKRGADKAKDQSYFLYRLSQKQLSKTILPLGDYHKRETREIAATNGFGWLAGRPESQDFIGWDGYKLFFGGQDRPGNIVDIQGNVIGRHKGISRYTIGQRKGLNLAGMREPHFVMKIDAKKNEITAGTKDMLLKKDLIASNANWFIPLDEIDMPIYGQIRYRSKPALCTVYKIDNCRFRVMFHNPQEAITPGQSIVLYQDDTLIGGGIIEDKYP